MPIEAEGNQWIGGFVVFKGNHQAGSYCEAALLGTGGLRKVGVGPRDLARQIPEAPFQVGEVDIHRHAIDLRKLHLQPLGHIGIWDENRGRLHQ